MFGKKEEKNEEVEHISEVHESRSLPRGLKIIVVLVLTIGCLLLVAFVFDRFVREGSGPSDNEEWQVELLEVLRSYEQTLDEDAVEEWEWRRTMPYEGALDFALYTLSRFEYGHVIMKVGEEDIYTDDFSYKLYLLHNKEFISGKPLSDSLLLEVADDIISDSIILQASRDEGNIILTDDVFNYYDKDYKSRNILVRSVVDSVPDQEVTGEVISAWFYNVTPPEMGVDKARVYAEEMITDLQAQLASGEISMKEAGEQLRTDPGMITIDSGLEGNAYSGFSISADHVTFFDESVQKAILNLSEGEVSDVMPGKDTTSDGEVIDAYFIVAEVTSMSNVGYTFDGWYLDVEKNYDVTVIGD